MDVRKRPMSPADNHGPANKKRIISAGGNSTKVTNVTTNQSMNGTEDGEEEDEPQGHDLECFRKEAIFRRMRHYAREYEREQQKSRELEKRCSVQEASLAAVEACWRQLVGQVRTLVPNGLPPLDDASLELYNLAKRLAPAGINDQPQISTQYYNQLQETSRATQAVIASFVKLAPTSSSPDIRQLRETCSQSQSLVAALESEKRLLQSRLMKAEQKAEEYREELAQAENKVERVRSETVVMLESSLGRRSLEVDVKKEETTDDRATSVAVSTPIMSNGVLNGHVHSSDDDDWRARAEIRERTIQQLMMERASLENTVTSLREELAAPTAQTVGSSAPYQLLLAEVNQLKTANAEVQAVADKLTAEGEELRNSRQEFERTIQVEANKKIDDMNGLLHKQNVEMTRIRSAREAAIAENHERKTKETEKFNSLNALTALNKVNADRISALNTEVKRLKARLAAGSGNQDLLAFILGASSSEAKYVEDLQGRLTTAQKRVQALETTLAKLDQQSPDVAKLIRSESEARQLYDRTRESLEKYERTYGSTSTSVLSGDAKQLSNLLKQKEEAFQAMKLKQQTTESETEAVYAEMETLMQSFEALDKQCHSKILDLTALEDRCTRLQTEKAKADNKYFSMVRVKESLEGEQKKTNGVLGKQKKYIEMLQEGEKNLRDQMAQLEKEVMAARAIADTHQKISTGLQDEKRNIQIRLDDEAERLAALRKDLQERQTLADTRRTEGRKWEEENARLRKESEKASFKLNRAPAADASQRELDLQSENDKLFKLLRCSTCTKEFRTHVLVKCMHTFCKSCLDARVTTRQRKCPACQMSFAVSDVQALYFQ